MTSHRTGRRSDHAQEGRITPCLRVVNHIVNVFRLGRFTSAFEAEYTSGPTAGVNNSGESVARRVKLDRCNREI
jgi:hypothetical protein